MCVGLFLLKDTCGSGCRCVITTAIGLAGTGVFFLQAQIVAHKITLCQRQIFNKRHKKDKGLHFDRRLKKCCLFNANEQMNESPAMSY